MVPPERFDISPHLTGGCSEGLDEFSDFYLKTLLETLHFQNTGGTGVRWFRRNVLVLNVSCELYHFLTADFISMLTGPHQTLTWVSGTLLILIFVVLYQALVAEDRLSAYC